ncbi:MAG: hypothetical protein ACD_11C00103G0050 [uncultured bacterium]|nr:MAG: hypothetical protein ACD_11C00103G0050 [uncultured bacterium]HBR71212.1 hypothetical protein [Candidatus Moranbacteria bacterium]
MDNNTQSQALSDLVKDLKIESLPQDKQNKIIIKMTEALLKRIFIETMEAIGEKGRDEYEELLKKNSSPEELEKFFMERIKDYDEFMQKVIVDFKKEIIDAR